MSILTSPLCIKTNIYKLLLCFHGIGSPLLWINLKMFSFKLVEPLYLYECIMYKKPKYLGIIRAISQECTPHSSLYWMFLCLLAITNIYLKKKNIAYWGIFLLLVFPCIFRLLDTPNVSWPGLENSPTDIFGGYLWSKQPISETKVISKVTMHWVICLDEIN